MSSDQLIILALVVPAIVGALYIARVFTQINRPLLVGGVVGALSGLGGSFTFLTLINFCTFTAESSFLDQLLGFTFAFIGGLVGILLAQLASQTFLDRSKPVVLGGDWLPGMFKGWLLPWLLLLPSLVILVLFLYYPAIQTMRMAVFNTSLQRGVHAERFICMDNFTRLLDEGGFTTETGLIVLLILGALFLIRYLNREDQIGQGLQIITAVLLVVFAILRLPPFMIGVAVALTAMIVLGQDRDSWGNWLKYGAIMALALIFFQDVLGEILASRSTNNYYRVVSNTFFMSIVIVVLNLAMSLAIAYVAYQPIKGGSIYRTLLIWPYAISPPVAGIIFDIIFNPTSAGLANHILDTFGFMQVNWKSAEFAPWTIIAASVWKSLGFSILFYIAGLQNIPKDLVEAAAIDGANLWQRFTRIVIPMLSPITFYLVITTITYAFFDIFGTIDYLTRGGPAGASTVMIYSIYDTFNSDYLGRAAAQSVILFTLVAGITYLQFRTSGRNVTYGGQ
jgi:sn-glycerol 3-phosphate transport system permease protein